MSNKKRIKTRLVDTPPPLRPVRVLGIAASSSGDGVILHMEDARNEKTCDIKVHNNQVSELIEKLRKYESSMDHI